MLRKGETKNVDAEPLREREKVGDKKNLYNRPLDLFQWHVFIPVFADAPNAAGSLFPR